jgi:hypothetical protein
MLDGLYGVASTIDADGNWNIGQMMMDPGVHTIVIMAGDDAHNWSDPTSVTFTILPSESKDPGSPGPDLGPPGSNLGPPNSPGSDGDVTPPTLRLGKLPKAKTTSKKFKLAFSSNEAGSSFKCKLDSGAFKSCTAPYSKRVKAGKHKLTIVAIDAAGNRSAGLTVKWRVVSR